jgi:hypothetical protein
MASDPAMLQVHTLPPQCGKSIAISPRFPSPGKPLFLIDIGRKGENGEGWGQGF